MDPSQALKAIARARQNREKVYQATITQQQVPYLKDFPAKGRIRVSRFTIPADGYSGIIEAVEEVIRLLGDGSETYDVPKCVDIKGEWVGYRGVDEFASEPNISKAEKYDRIMRDVEDDSVMFYAHGGASYVGSAAASRPLTSKLATLSHSRVFSLNYRLAPQHPFPAQVVDLLLAYLFLLYPPPGSLHTPVSASKIVFIGDSFGAVLFLSLIQVLLTLKSLSKSSKSHPRILVRGQGVSLPLPAGCAFVSAYSYNPEHFPSWENNKGHDIFPYHDARLPFFASPNFPSCDVWPSSPPRGDLFCDTSMMGHPLLFASAAKTWKGCPPMYFASGQERCLDSIKMVASLAVEEGVSVQWEEYEGMCHVFMLFFPQWKQSEMCYTRWAAFIKQCVNGKSVQTRGVIIGIEDLKERTVDVRKLSQWPPNYATDKLEDAKGDRRDWLEKIKRGRSVL